MPPVTALRPQTYQGRSLVAGDVFECEAVEASIRARAGVVALRGRVVAAPPRTKRRYRRRDLTAERG